MRLLIASMAALAAVAFAAPSFAQDETMPAPTSSPTAKPKAGTTAASCNKIKSSSQRSACLKKVQVAKAQPAKKTKKPTGRAEVARCRPAQCRRARADRRRAVLRPGQRSAAAVEDDLTRLSREPR